MNGTKLFVCSIIIWLTSSKLLIRAEESLNNSQISLNKIQNLKIFPGIQFFLTDSEINIHMRVHDLLQGIDSTLFTLALYLRKRLRFLFFRDGSASQSEEQGEEESFAEARIHDDDSAISYAGFSYLLFSLTFPAKRMNDKIYSLFQILSLPGAIATIKMSLLRSIMVAQLAIAIMIYNLIRSSQNSDVVVVHKPYYQTHYRHKYPLDNDEDEWFGR